MDTPLTSIQGDSATLRMESTMRIHFKPLGFTAGESLQAHILRRLSATLSHFADHLGRVVVRLSDTNGPRGGVDKACSISLELPRQSPVVVHAASSDFFSAVDLASRRAGRAVERAFQRRFS